MPRKSKYANIEINDDGKTAYCEICKQNKPLKGFSETTLFWGSRYEPPEYGQICADCQKKEDECEKEMSRWMEGMKYEDFEWLSHYRQGDRANAKVPPNFTGD